VDPDLAAGEAQPGDAHGPPAATAMLMAAGLACLAAVRSALSLLPPPQGGLQVRVLVHGDLAARQAQVGVLHRLVTPSAPRTVTFSALAPVAAAARAACTPVPAPRSPGSFVAA